MDARRIEIFLRIAELGSINKAATELRISQPSLSRLLAHLEEEVGAPLLVRTRQGVSLTDAGEILVERAQPLLRQLQMIREEIGTRASSHFNLAMPFSLQRFVTAPLAEAILREAPQTTLRIYEGINNSIRIWMERGLVDAAVMVSTERAPDTFAATPLLHEGLMLVGDRKAGLRLDAPAPLSRLGAAQLILPGRPNVISAQVENALRRSGLPYQNRFEAESLSLCIELTRRGLGYTVMPYSALHHQLEIGGAHQEPQRDLATARQPGPPQRHAHPLGDRHAGEAGEERDQRRRLAFRGGLREVTTNPCRRGAPALCGGLEGQVFAEPGQPLMPSWPRSSDSPSARWPQSRSPISSVRGRNVRTLWESGKKCVEMLGESTATGSHRG